VCDVPPRAEVVGARRAPGAGPPLYIPRVPLPHARVSPRRLPPLLVLAASLALTAVATAVVAATGREREEARFANAADLTRTRVDSRMRTYATILRSARGLFAASGEVTPEEFRTFVGQFDVRHEYRGVQGIGFARRVRQAELDAFVTRWRTVADSTFQIRNPDPPRPEYFPIVMLEPLDVRNERAIGYDMYADSVRREAMARARDTGRPIVSGRVVLVQEDPGDSLPGFLVYLPVYETVVPPATVEARRASLLGFVYAPFRAPDLFAELDSLGTAPVAMAVYDGARVDRERLLHDGTRRADADPSYERTDSLVVFGRRWTLALASRPVIEEGLARLYAPAVAIAGTIVSLLFFVVMRREVRARVRAEQSDRSRSRFYAGMSHELRTPLNAIMGYNDLLRAGVHGPIAAAQEQAIERSQRAARHLLELVNDVLDLSKLEAGKLELEAIRVHVPSLVEELFHTVHTLAERRGSTLRLDCDGDVPAIDTDPRRVRQILLSLLSNAIKFGEGRPITVRCGRRGADGVCVDVVDQGTGIPPEEQERIFEEFVQLPADRPGGTGLGLPISRRLARLLGGHLTVRSEPGRGSTFRLELPGAMPGA